MALLDFVGKTETGEIVVDFFSFFDSQGLPLDLLVDTLKQAGYVPAWGLFYDHAVRAGWNPKSTFIKLETTVLDVYGTEYHEKWRERMRLFVMFRSSFATTQKASGSSPSS